MAPIFDCHSCGGPMPFGVSCPHCAKPVARSLRAIALHFALLGAAGCCSSSAGLSDPSLTLGGGSSSGGMMTFTDAYGIPFLDAGCRAGDVCACSGTQICVCSETSQCVPYMDSGE